MNGIYLVSAFLIAFIVCAGLSKHRNSKIVNWVKFLLLALLLSLILHRALPFIFTKPPNGNVIRKIMISSDKIRVYLKSINGQKVSADYTSEKLAFDVAGDVDLATVSEILNAEGLFDDFKEITINVRSTTGAVHTTVLKRPGRVTLPAATVTAPGASAVR